MNTSHDRTPRPNHALQRTGRRVTLAAARHPAAFARHAPGLLSAAIAPLRPVAELGVVRPLALAQF